MHRLIIAFDLIDPSQNKATIVKEIENNIEESYRLADGCYAIKTEQLPVSLLVVFKKFLQDGDKFHVLTVSPDYSETFGSDEISDWLD